MITLYESQFQKIEYLEESSFLMTYWKPYTVHLTDEKHLFELHTLYMHVRKKNPQRFLSDLRELNYKIKPESEEAASNLFKDHAAPFIAIVVKGNTAVEKSIKGLFNQFKEVVPHGFTLRYFHERVPAEKWLLEC